MGRSLRRFSSAYWCGGLILEQPRNWPIPPTVAFEVCICINCDGFFVNYTSTLILFIKKPKSLQLTEPRFCRPSPISSKSVKRFTCWYMFCWVFSQINLLMFKKFKNYAMEIKYKNLQLLTLKYNWKINWLIRIPFLYLQIFIQQTL